MSLKITYRKFYENLPGANELKSQMILHVNNTRGHNPYEDISGEESNIMIHVYDKDVGSVLYYQNIS